MVLFKCDTVSKRILQEFLWLPYYLVLFIALVCMLPFVILWDGLPSLYYIGKGVWGWLKAEVHWVKHGPEDRGLSQEIRFRVTE
jgi:hypothetical protein